MPESEPPRLRRPPGGTLPPNLARDHTAPPAAGEPLGGRRRPLGLVRSAWQDDEDPSEAGRHAGRTGFRRMVGGTDEERIRPIRGPALSVLVGLLLVVGVVALATVLYHLAPH